MNAGEADLMDPPPTIIASTRPMRPIEPPPLARPMAVGGAATPAPSSTPLSQALAPDIMAEIARRRKSAVLVVFETPIGDSYDISRQPGANVRCYRTGDMNDAQVMQVLGELGNMSQGQRNQKGGIGLTPEIDATPFELKGDRLGMALLDFKKKYLRNVGGLTLPYTSESLAGQSNPTLWCEPWHASAGIVHARTELPSENNSPTVAGVKTELFLYHFVDSRLFRITALFDTEAFHVVRKALVDKQGQPTTEIKDPMELSWENAVSTIRLVRGTMRPKKLSTLLLIHHELQALAESRVPKRESDL
jgi:hypothetical protein